IVNEVNAKIAEEMATTNAKLKDGQLKSLADLEASSEEESAAIVRNSLSATAVAMVLGLLFAWIIASGITHPVLALAHTMDTLASGNLEADVPGTDRRDQLGKMAKSVLSFKQAGIENIRLQKETADKDQRALAERAQREKQDAERKIEADKRAQ